MRLRKEKGKQSVWIGIEQTDHRLKGGSFHEFISMTLYVLGNKGYHEEDTPDFTGDKIDMVQATQRCSTKEFLLDPLDGPFVIVPCASRRGVQGDFWVRVATESDFELSPVILPTPNAEQAAAMAPYKVPTYCLHCKKQLPEVTEETFVVEDGKVHSECYQAFKMANSDVCVQCKKPIISGKVVVIEGKKLHAACNDAYSAANGQKCAVCKKPVGEDFFEMDGGAVTCSEKCADKWDEDH